MLREAILSGSELGDQAKKLMDKGILIPDEVIIKLVVERIGESDCDTGFLFDGFPRTIPQAIALNDESIDLLNAKIAINYAEGCDVSKRSDLFWYNGLLIAF